MKQIGTEFTIDSVSEYVLGNGVELWVVRLINERGEVYPYSFPKFAIEQRIAEYDLDPTDIEGALDLILHEPHIPDPTDPRNFATDAAAQSGLKAAAVKRRGAVLVGQEVPMTLLNAPDRASAKKAHQARIAEVKKRISIKSAKKGVNPLKTIIDNHGVDPQRVKARSAYVEEIRSAALGKPNNLSKMVPVTPGAVPTRPNQVDTSTPYDTSVRRRGLTVTLLDSPRE